MYKPLLALGIALVLTTGAAAREHGPSLLSAAELDPLHALPPPPIAGTAQAAADLAELHTMQERRTPAEMEAARREGDDKRLEMFSEAAGQPLDPVRFPATARLFNMVRDTASDVVDRGKAEFRRPRPWIVDPSIASCSRGEDPLSSYPSGHATFAYAEAGVLARLIPNRAAPILARAAHFAETRIICEQHFRSDVTGGEALGLLVADRLTVRPQFRASFDAARRELAAAGNS